MVFDPDWKERTEPPTRVVNLRNEAYDVYIGRPGQGQDGYFGNHHPIGNCPICETFHTRTQAIAAFKKDFYSLLEHDEKFRERVKALRGKTLGCFCKPLNCHGDVYKEWLDSPASLT